MACLVTLFSDLAILHRDRAQPQLQKLFSDISDAIQELPDLYDVNSEVEDLQSTVNNLEYTIEEKADDSALENAKERIEELEAELTEMRNSTLEALEAPEISA